MISASGQIINTGAGGIISASGGITNQYTSAPISSAGGFQTTSGSIYNGNGSGLTGLAAANITPGGVLPALGGGALTALNLATNALYAGLATNVVTGISITNAQETGGSYVNGTYSGNGVGLTNYASTNLITDSTIISAIDLGSSFSAPSPATNWQAFYTDANMTNFQICGTYLPLRMVQEFSVFADTALIQTITGGTLGEKTYGASVSFGVDGNTFIVALNGNSQSWSMAVNGGFVYTNTVLNDGNPHNIQFVFATNARKVITLYNPFPFYGVYVPSTNGFTPNRQAITHTVAILGDSFTEQDFNGISQCRGYVCEWQNKRPDLNLIPLGEGGTGFYITGGSGGTNFFSRVNDVVNCNPEQVVIFGGINDQQYGTNTSLTNGIFTSATNLFMQLKMRLPNVPIICVGPQESSSPLSTSYYATATLISNACVLNNVPWVNPLNQPWITGTYNINNSGNAVNYIDPIDSPHYTCPAGSIYFANQLNGVLASNVSSLYPTDKRQVTLTNIGCVFAGTFLTASTNNLPVTSGGVTNNTGLTYLLTITAGTAMTLKDVNGNPILTPAINGAYPLKPNWRFAGTAVTAQAVILSQ